MRKLYTLSKYSRNRVQSDNGWCSSEKFSLVGVLLIVSLACLPYSLFAQGRYGARNINAEADAFYSRFDNPLINSDFIVLAIKDSANYKVNDALDSSGIEQTSAGSVIIYPGVDLGNSDIININDGDSDIIAIGD